MSDFVLDASVAGAWLLHEEKNAEAENALKLLEKNKAVVPYLWHVEIRNIIVKTMRRDKHDVGWSEKTLLALDDLPIRTDYQLELKNAFSLAVKHRLSFHDAVYLELGKRLDAPIATLDKALARAADAEELLLVCQ